MKTIQDLNKLIDKQLAQIETLDNEKREGASNEEWAVRRKKIIKQRVKCKDEITHLRKLILFAERTPEDGVRFMYEKLIREVTAATNTARRIFDPNSEGKGKLLIREYLSASDVPLKNKQIKELDFLLS